MLLVWPRIVGSPSTVPLVFGVLLTLSGCASYQARPFVERLTAIDTFSLRTHAKTQSDGDVRVTAAVLSRAEAEQAFGVNLELKWIQSIWLEVENRGDEAYWVLFPALDANYYSPNEVAYAFHLSMTPEDSHRLAEYLGDIAFKNPVNPGEVKSGIVFVNLDEGDKEVDVELLGFEGAKQFSFYFHVPGIKAQSVFDVAWRYPDQVIQDLGDDELSVALQYLPCCTHDREGNANGDPLNLVFIGNAEDLFPALVRRGWHPAEDTYLGSIWKTVNSFIFGSRYRYSPVSPLYAFGRKQDIALQKARGTIHQRNHFRLWLTPLRYQGKSIWIGQISRDIGVRFTTKSKTLVTHKIDPDVDEARSTLVQDMLVSRGLSRIGFSPGVGVSTPDAPATNLTGDPYFTDGLRAVLMFERGLTPLREIDFFSWAATPDGAVTLDPD